MRSHANQVYFSGFRLLFTCNSDDFLALSGDLSFAYGSMDGSRGHGAAQIHGRIRRLVVWNSVD
jgi:hypothetical protein